MTNIIQKHYARRKGTENKQMLTRKSIDALCKEDPVRKTKFNIERVANSTHTSEAKMRRKQESRGHLGLVCVLHAV